MQRIQLSSNCQLGGSFSSQIQGFTTEKEFCMDYASM
jgi:hypothetical protein